MTLTLKRYFDLTLLAITSICIALLFNNLNFIIKFYELYSTLINSLHYSIQHTIPFLLGISTQLLLVNLGVSHNSRLITPNWRYPPLYLSLWLIIPLMIYLTNFPITKVSIYQTYCFLAGAFCYILFMIVKPSERNAETNVSDKLESRSLDQLTDKELLDWASNESAVKVSKNLLFNRDIYVSRMAQRLTKEKSHHIALCGEYGSGKTSLLNILEQHLDTSHWITARIDNWGRSIDTVGSQVLGIILNKLTEKFDTCALKPLPKNYQQALKASGKWYSVLTSLTSNSEIDLHSQLSKLDEILVTLNIKLLVCLEDVDRNYEAEKFCAELAVLLDKLNNINNINFIVATGYTPNIGSIVSRVCNYREDLSNESQMEVIDRFINLWISRANESKVQLHEKYLNKQFSIKNHSSGIWGGPFDSIEFSLDALISTPRACKQICRRVDEVWQLNKLMGEVDLLDLIVLFTLREVNPDIFELIVKFQRELKCGIRTVLNNKEDQQKEIGTIVKIFNEVIPSGNQGHSISKAIEMLFPHWPNFTDDGFTENFPYEQRLNTYSNFTNYMDRCLREKVGNVEISDQEFIRVLCDYKDRETDRKLIAGETLLNHLIDDVAWVERFMCFSKPYCSINHREMDNNFVAYLFIDLMKELKKRYQNGFNHVNEFNISLGHISNITGLIKLTTWFKDYCNFRRTPRLMKLAIIAFNAAIKVDFLLANQLLINSEEFMIKDIQPTLKSKLYDTLLNDENIKIYSSLSSSTLLLDICKGLSCYGSENTLSRGFQINDWEVLLIMLTEKAFKQSSYSPQITMIVASFFMNREEHDSRTFIINSSHIKQVPHDFLNLLYRTTLAHPIENLVDSFEDITLTQVKLWYQHADDSLG